MDASGAAASESDSRAAFVLVEGVKRVLQHCGDAETSAVADMGCRVLESLGTRAEVGKKQRGRRISGIGWRRRRHSDDGVHGGAGEGAQASAPVTDIGVVFRDEPVPEGYSRVRQEPLASQLDPLAPESDPAPRAPSSTGLSRASRRT